MLIVEIVKNNQPDIFDYIRERFDFDVKLEKKEANYENTFNYEFFRDLMEERRGFRL